MVFRAEPVRQAIQDFDFKSLFEELGWDHPPANQSVEVQDRRYELRAVADKSGMVAYVHRSEEIPERDVRTRIERQLAKAAYEHLLIFTDDAQTRQVWQWVRRQRGQTPRYREHTYRRGQTGELLVQKLQPLAFSLDEDPSIADVTGRARKAFDVDRITRRFYDKFRSEHTAFQKFLKAAIPVKKDREVYASVMLDRLMFVYFIQRKGFLDDDRDYLRTRLKRVQRLRGQGRFLSFYRQFLRRFFHEGLGQPKIDPDPELIALIGDVPYLNGGIFDVHELERRYPDIQVDDLAFVKLFDFFDRYDWRLDERPLRADNEINPDVLGYIFEKHINQKQMGAYYTKEDITGYIAQNTIIPRLFDMARKHCDIAFRPNSALWRLLSEDPDRYIYPAVRKGVDLPLPNEIAAGQDDVSRRDGWNAPADQDYALPTETWREHIARRRRYEEVWEKLVDGEIHRVDDLITLNLDIRRFVQDAILDCEGPDLLRAFWKAIRAISVLDPACGSGAFLFAALNVLEPLYDACLSGMQAFVHDLDRSDSGPSSRKFSDFRKYLNEVASHPNRRYYILKSIVIGNLYGVDIMEEAVDICKLRLFLKLVAQADTVKELEPLPDIDFNIRAGNSLVGFTSLDAVRRAMTVMPDGQYRQVFPEDQAVLDRIEEEARIASRAFEQFRRQQTELGGEITPDHKAALRRRLESLGSELDRHLAGEYSVNLEDTASYAVWLDSHMPFHWFAEFYGIMNEGGFDVVIGNPPYVEYSKVRKNYQIKGFVTERCGNLYAYMLEQSYNILHISGWLGMIVQLSYSCTERMQPIQSMSLERSGRLWLSHFDDRPAKLFDGLEHIRATIIISGKSASQIRLANSTVYNRWHTEARDSLFHTIRFNTIPPLELVPDGTIPKTGQHPDTNVLRRISRFRNLGKSLPDTRGNTVYFHNSPQYWVRSMDFVPYFWNERDGEHVSRQVKDLNFPTSDDAAVVVAMLNSSLFYWWFLILSDCRHLNLREIESFPIGLDLMPTTMTDQLVELTAELMESFRCHSQRKETRYRTTGKVIYDEFDQKPAKPIVDEIDRVLAKHYGFTDEELDFIINYDIKYRMGWAG